MRLLAIALSCAIAIIGTIAIIGYATPPPPPSMEETMRQFEFDIAQIHLIGAMAKCVGPLNPAQVAYLTHISAYAAQHYLLAMADTRAADACQSSAITDCEKISPGKCVAPKPN